MVILTQLTEIVQAAVEVVRKQSLNKKKLTAL